MKTKLLIFTSTLFYANAKTMPRNLNNQPHIIAGDTNHSVPEYYGDMPHAGAQGDSLDATTDILHEEIVNGLRSEFDFLRNSLTGSGDGDGFVREGIVFCGFTGVADGNLTNIPASFSSDTTSLVPEDGYGGTAALDIQEVDYCTSNKCEEGSFVSTIVNRIRSAGYHVTHSDVCSAKATAAWNEVAIPTCQMNGYTNSATPPAPLVSYSYKADAGANDAWLHDRKKCQKKKKTDCTTSTTTTPDGCIWNSQQFCAPECSYSNSAACANTYGTHVSSIADDSTRKDGGTTPSKNEVRRETAYEDFIGEVVTDRIFVTGVENVGANNCKSLRQYVAALNGLAQINAFRDVGIMQGQAVWGAIVEKMSQNFRGIAILLNDFHDMSLKMFPGIEFSEFDECPTGNTNRPFDEEGTPEVPLCTKTNFKSQSQLNAQGAIQQGILRDACFCRQASSGYLKNADAPYLEWKQSRITTLCSSSTALTNNKVAKKYVCEPRIGKDLTTWKSHLENLEPKEHKILTYGTNKAARKTALMNKIKLTMNLVEDDMTIDCGRLVSVDKGIGTSNKGGNCIPFAEMNDMLYKLEIMTSDLEKDDTFFITDSNTTDVHFGRVAAANWKESTSDNIGYAMEDIDSFAGTTSDEQVFEAAFNVEIAMGLKRSVLDANEVTWLALREELTSLDKTRIIHSVAEKAALNFMRITTTDSDDKAVDSGTDTDAVNANGENPTQIP
jgi:hypothetical protein